MPDELVCTYNILLDLLLVELATDQSLDVEDGSRRIGGVLVLGGVTDQSLFVGEGDP